MRDLNDAPGERVVDPVVDGEIDQDLVDYVARYGHLQPWEAVQDVSYSPDFPTVAKVWRQLLPQAGREPIDGVIQLDPFALAALMEFSGPVQVEGLDERLDAENAAQFLLVDQYALFGERAEREDVLEEVLRDVFDELTTGDLPEPGAFADVLAPLVHQGRLSLHAFDPAEQAAIETVGADNTFPRGETVDSLAVVNQNGGQNKIDAYLERDIAYDVELDPATGSLEAEVTVRLTNAVPSLDLPDAVVGSNDQGLPPGTNETLLSIYSPHRFESLEVDGQPVGSESAHELGHGVYTVRLQVGPGETTEVRLVLSGRVGPLDRYELTYNAQPLVHDDQVSVAVRLVGDGRFEVSPAMTREPSQRAVSTEGVVREDRIYEADIGR
jgi:hypothetical protein